MTYSTVFSVLEQAAAKFSKSVALHQPIAGSKPTQYRTYTWGEYRDAVVEIACGLRKLGVQPGEYVALYSETRAEFYLADIGVMTAGAVAAALYTASPLGDNVRNLSTIGAKVVFVEDRKTHRLLTEGLRGEVIDLTWILLEGDDPHTLTLDGLRQMGREAMKADKELLRQIRSEVKPDSDAVLYLTSGATGEPKMGLVTHRAIVANLSMGPFVLPLTQHDSTIAFLPSAHIAQRVVVELLPIVSGTPVWFSESLMKLPHEMQAIKPTMLLAPPRLWERIYSNVCGEIKKRGGIAEKVFYASLGLSMRANEYRRRGDSVPAWMTLPLAIGDQLLFRKVRQRLGGRLKYAISGAAPLGKDLAIFFEAIGTPLIEGYGLTEGGITIFNPVETPKPGSIGKPLPGVELKLAEDGELAIHSPTLFRGYLNDEAATQSVLRDGWLYTGDIAKIDEDGYVFITGRKKEVLVASNGKKIYPALIETLFKGEPMISHVVLAGDRLPYVTALVTLNPSARDEARDVDGEVKKAVSRVNAKLAAYEQIRKFKILDKDFSVESGELTPTMKVRRTKVLENYKELVAQMYQGKEESH